MMKHNNYDSLFVKRRALSTCGSWMGQFNQASEDECSNKPQITVSVGVLWGDPVYDPHMSGKKMESFSLIVNVTVVL